MWRLADAIIKGDLPQVKRLVEQEHVNIDGDDYDGFGPPSCINHVRNVRVPLLIAQLEGQDEIVRYLIEKGARVNQPMWGSEETILHKAVGKNNYSLVRYLLHHPDIEVDVFDWREVTPLLKAVKQHRPELVAALLDHRPEVEEALAVAIRLGNLEVVREFFKPRTGADPHQIGDNGRPLIYTAAKWGYRILVDLLLELGYADIENRKNCPAVSAAAGQGHLAVVKRLVESGWNPDGEEIDIRVLPPLHSALRYGHKKIATYLLQQKADVNLIDAEGTPAVFYAAQMGDVKILKALDFLGADLSAVVDGVTLIQKAVACCHSEAVEFLLSDTKRAVDVNQRAPNGHSLLRIAADKCDFDTFCVLEKNGAVPDPTLDFTSRMFSANQVDQGFFTLMLKHCPDLDKRDCEGWTPLTWAANCGWTRTVVKLIRKGADIEGTSVDGQTALHKAVMSGYSQVVSILLAKGANPNARGNQGETPLHIAAADGRKHETDLLLVFGGATSNPRVANVGRCALQVAGCHPHKSVVQMLIRSGADAGIRDENRQTALDYAIANRYEQMAIELKRGLNVAADNSLQINISF